MIERVAILGSVNKIFDPVREAFAENFIKRNELGAACCIYYKGEKVVDAPPRLILDIMNPRSRINRALWGDLPEDKEHVYPRNVEVPSGGGIGTARSIAKAYGVFAAGGKELGLRDETLKQLMAPAIPPACGFYDEVMRLDGLQMSLGFMKPGSKNSFAHPSSFGMVGFGGNFGFADPDAQVGFAYVANLNGLYLMDPRQNALRFAMYRCIGETDPTLTGGETRGV